jgi:hypothetical protein
MFQRPADSGTTRVEDVHNLVDAEGIDGFGGMDVSISLLPQLAQI